MLLVGDPRQTFHHAYAIFQLPGAQASTTRLNFAPRARFCAPISKAICQGVAGRINISGATHGLVKDFFDCEFRGKVASKHKGEIDMYFVNRIRRELSIDAEGRTPNEEFLQLYSLLGLPRPVGQTNLVTVVETEKSQTTDLASENS